MAEVKTYKCDICGKVYHRDENETHFMRIIHQPLDDTERKFDYEFLCDGCIRNVHEVIDNPDIFKNKIKALNDAKQNLYGFKHLISKIRDKVYPYSIFCDVSDDPEVYGNYVDKFISAYDELEKSCERRKTIMIWTAVICGAVIGVLLGFIV